MITIQQENLISLLLASFPNFQSGDADAALAAYGIVIEQADARDVEPGIMMLINGQLPGFDGRFAPTSAQLARAIRISLERRVDAENAQRAALPPPKDDWVEPPPEVKARNKAKLDALVESLGKTLRTEDAENDRKAKELTARVNARFAPEMDSWSMAKRLGLAIDVGDDPEADYGDMGGERVA